MSDAPAEDSYELRTTSTVRRALSETLPEAVAAAAYEFITGPLIAAPHRIGKRLVPPMDDRFSARRGTYRVIYRIDDKARAMSAISSSFPPSAAMYPARASTVETSPCSICETRPGVTPTISASPAWVNPGRLRCWRAGSPTACLASPLPGHRTLQCRRANSS